MRRQIDSDIKRIIDELSKTITELKREDNFAYDPVIARLERVIHYWRCHLVGREPIPHFRYPDSQ
ncbi:hypothetical protein L0222_28235 [bacterium]|nr:hypothetical protein [bacterium]MCI0606900.1 hypothetical protein [bacterium]